MRKYGAVNEVGVIVKTGTNKKDMEMFINKHNEEASGWRNIQRYRLMDLTAMRKFLTPDEINSKIAQ